LFVPNLKNANFDNRFLKSIKKIEIFEQFISLLLTKTK
jgi:hypothetical protein